MSSSNDENYVAEVASKIREIVDSKSFPAEGAEQLFMSYALLALAKGIEVTNEDVHDAWSIWASEHDPNSSSLVPFDELDLETQGQDTRFRDAIISVARDLD